ncbi:MAG: SCO family protein, partial [Woeseia sp.]
MTHFRYIIAGTFIVLGLAGGAYFLSKAVQPQSLQDATVLPDSRALPPFELIDDSGQPFGNQRLAGNWTLLFFGFTHCPDICPATLQQLSIARQQLAEKGIEPLPEIVLISVDPERDTAEALSAYVRNFGDHVTGVSGELG